MLNINEIYHGDCLKVMKEIDNKSMNLILTDLPYGVTQNAKDIRIPFELLWKHYERIIKDNGAILLFSQGIFYIDLVNSNRKLFRYDLIWDKQLVSGFLNANRMPLRVHEQIAVFYKKKPVYNPQYTEGKPLHSKGKNYLKKEHKNENYGKFKMTNDNRAGSKSKHPKSIISFKKPHPSISLHRNEKSIDCLEYLIKTYTNKGDLVLDSAAGSFTVAVAAENLKRNWICIEKEQKYCDIGRQRIKDNRERLKIF